MQTVTAPTIHRPTLAAPAPSPEANAGAMPAAPAADPQADPAAAVRAAAMRVALLKPGERFAAIRMNDELWAALQARCVAQGCEEQLNVLRIGSDYLALAYPGYDEFRAVRDEINAEARNIPHFHRASFDAIDATTFRIRAQVEIARINMRMLGAISGLVEATLNEARTRR